MWKTWSPLFPQKSSGVMGSGSRHISLCWTRWILCKVCLSSLSTTKNPYWWWLTIKCMVWISVSAVYLPKEVIIETCVIYIMQNLFDQHKEHRTISLNAHYLVIFKNPRDGSQIVHLAKQMYPGKNHYVRQAFALAKASRISCGRFETDHSRRDEVTKSYFPQWSTGSLCGRYIRLGKRIRDHWMSRRRRVYIGMTSRVKRQAPLLLASAKAHPHVCKAILRGADKELLQCLSECALNILKGNVTLKPSEKARLTKYRQKLRKVADKKVSLKQKHKILQTGGFAPALLAPLLAPLIAPLAKRAVGGLARKAVGGLLQGVLDKI